MKQYKDTHFYGTPDGNVFKLTKNGYQKVGWKNTRNYVHVTTLDRKSIKTHRIIAELFIPNPNNLPHVNHKNGITTDNRVENLEWITPSNNQKHAYKIGLRQTKINYELANHIRNEIKNGVKMKTLAEKFNISYGIVLCIKNNKTYDYAENN